MKRILAAILFLFLLAACGSSGKPSKGAEEQTAAPEAGAEAPPAAAAEEHAEADGELSAVYERAKTDLVRLGGAIEAYWQNEDHFPAVQTVRELATLPGFAPGYIKEVPFEDPWGNEYLYEYSDFGFSVGCGGSDGVFEGFDQAGEIDLEPGVDIIYKNNGLSLNPQEKTSWDRP